MPVLIGTSGWQYRDWRGSFYPADLAQAKWLEYYAERFQTQEVNNAFYRLPEATTFAAWAERTPDDFVMVVKASRFLTHIKRLKDPEEPVQRFVERASCLGRKLGPVLLQLPPTMKADVERLDRALSLFPSDWRLAVEFRHDTWHIDEVRDVLSRHNAAWCMADSPSRVVPEWRTADWGYLRLHEGTGTPHPCFTEEALDRWAARVAELFPADEEVFVFFNNDPKGCAVKDAQYFAVACREQGLAPTRVPGEPVALKTG
ncbi:MAG TPA: DUF72 domain-containing protein [Acidimicrobiales bacterium]